MTTCYSLKYEFKESIKSISISVENILKNELKTIDVVGICYVNMILPFVRSNVIIKQDEIS